MELGEHVGADILVLGIHQAKAEPTCVGLAVFGLQPAGLAADRRRQVFLIVERVPRPIDAQTEEARSAPLERAALDLPASDLPVVQRVADPDESLLVAQVD